MRAGSLIESHALVLGFVPLKESDRLVHLLTADHGRISAIAPQAARSVKRFGNSLEPMSHIKAHLQIPREGRGATENPIWRLEKADLKNSFLHFRKSYGLIETAFFVLRMIMDLVPEGNGDPALFRSLGRFFKESEPYALEKKSALMRAAFWEWFSYHLGLGSVTHPIKNELGVLADAWFTNLSQTEPDFKNFFRILNETRIPDLTPSQEVAIYEKWIQSSGMHWPYFEQWLQSRKHFSS